MRSYAFVTRPKLNSKFKHSYDNIPKLNYFLTNFGCQNSLGENTTTLLHRYSQIKQDKHLLPTTFTTFLSTSYMVQSMLMKFQNYTGLYTLLLCSGLCVHSKSRCTNARSTSGNCSNFSCNDSPISCAWLRGISLGNTMSTSTK